MGRESRGRQWRQSGPRRLRRGPTKASWELFERSRTATSLASQCPPWYIPGMSDDRKKHLWPWIVALLIGLPVLYVASFGPACWISSRFNIGRKVLPTAYRPITAGIRIKDFQWCIAQLRAGGSVTMQPRRSGLDVLDWYSRVGSAEHWHWCYDVRLHPGNKVEQHWVWRKVPTFD